MDKLTIINRSLTRCGAEPIATLSDNSKRALLAVAQYESTLKEILNDTTWNFATTRIELTQGDKPLYGFSYSYELPSNVIRVVEINSIEKFRVEGRSLLTDLLAEPFYAKVLVYETDETKWNPSFVKAFYLKLAEDMSYALVQSASLQQAIIAEAERYLRRARSYNSQEGTPESRYPEDITFGLRQ